MQICNKWKERLLAKIATIALGSITSLQVVFTFYLLVALLTEVWRITRFSAHMEQARDCFLWFQTKNNTHFTIVSFLFSPKAPPVIGAWDGVLPPWCIESSSTDMAIESVVARSCGSPEVQTQRNGPNPREKMSLGREHVSLRDNWNSFLIYPGC